MKKTTTKILAAVCAVLMTMTLAGCNQGDSTTKSSGDNSTTTGSGLPIDASHSDIGAVSTPDNGSSGSSTPVSSTTSDTSDTSSDPNSSFTDSSSSTSEPTSNPNGGGGNTSTPELTKVPDIPLEELPLVPPIGARFDDEAPLNIVMINGMPIDLLTVNPKEFCQKANNFLMQIDDNYVNTKKYENKAGFKFEGVPVAQGFNGSATVYVETLDSDGELLTEWRLDTDPENPLPYDDYEIKGIHYDMPFGRILNISFVGGLIDMGLTREEVEETLGYGYEQHIEKKYTDNITGEEEVEFTNLVYYKNTNMSMVLEYKQYDGAERLMGITLVKNIDKHDQR